jgi:radical SAM protein with 4Fe4S-binding SPASM domain
MSSLVAGAKPNSNFHQATDRSVFDTRQEEAFKEYRRRWLEYPKSFTLGDFPMHLDVESTGVCNLRCPFCATTTENWGPNTPGYMTWDVYQRIIDEGADNGLYAIKLSFRGEPMLHQKLHEMVAYAKQKGILDVYFNTNGTLLTEKRINQLIDAGLDRISISFEGTTKEVYEASRVGAKFEKVVQNVKTLRRIRDQRKASHPQIRMQMVMLQELKHTFRDYVTFWSPFVDEVAYLDARKEGPLDAHRGMVAEWACPYLWQRMSILWDGTLLPCQMPGIADFGLLGLGNVETATIKEMWLSEKSQHHRELHRNGRAHEIEACDRCSYRAKNLEKLGIMKPAQNGEAAEMLALITPTGRMAGNGAPD